MTEKRPDNHEEFLHEKEFFVEKNKEGKMVSVKKPVDFDEFPNAINLDGYQKEEPDEKTNSDLPYDHEDLRTGYKPEEKITKQSECLLEQTPKKDIHFLIQGAYVTSRDKELNAYRGGYCSKEIMVKRFINENGKWVVKKGLYKYQALEKVNFSFESRYDGETIHLHFKPGDTFYAAKSYEDKEKRKEMLKKTK